MGSLPTVAGGGHLKRSALQRFQSASSGKSCSFYQKPRSKLARLLLFEKINYLRWICTAASFFFVVLLFQAFLPISTVQNAANVVRNVETVGRTRRSVRSRLLELEFGEGIRFAPSRLLERFQKENREDFFMPEGRRGTRAGIIRPKLALVSSSCFKESNKHFLFISRFYLIKNE